VDLALRDLAGNALGLPVYKLLGGETKPRITSYCTGNDLEQHLKFGFKKLKLTIPYGPADGREGIKKNVDLAKHTRGLLGPDGEITTPPFITNTTRRTAVISFTGSPSSAMMSACKPGAIDPI
jgi:L-alanine-DL-glutamate epimerase-like enolase superfamily enzyme